MWQCGREDLFCTSTTYNEVMMAMASHNDEENIIIKHIQSHTLKVPLQAKPVPALLATCVKRASWRCWKTLAKVCMNAVSAHELEYLKKRFKFTSRANQCTISKNIRREESVSTSPSKHQG